MYSLNYETIDRFQENLWYLRQIFGLSGERYAALLGMHTSCIYNYQNTDRPLKPTNYIALRYVLENFDPKKRKLVQRILDILVDHPEEHKEEAEKIRTITQYCHDMTNLHIGTEELGKQIRHRLLGEIAL